MFNLRFISRQLLSFLFNAPYLIACFFPRRNNIWLFSAWFGHKFLDNPKYIYLYSLNQPNVTAVWLTKSKALCADMKNKGLPVEYSNSWRGIWLQLRCGVVVFTHDVQTEFNAWLIASRVKRIQTYHGIPLKKIGYDDEKSTLTRRRQKLIQHIFPFRLNRYDLVLATSTEDSNVFRTAFNVEGDAVIITGSARNDIFITKSKFNLSGSESPDNLKRVIYMPTFRGKPGSEFPLLSKSGFNYEAFDKRFRQANILLDIKLHPVQSLSQIDADLLRQCSNIKLANQDDDVYRSLLEYVALITDYSSIFFDFLLTGKPIYMAPFDIASYLLNDRNMYYNYYDICPSAVYNNWDELIDDIILNRYDFCKYKELINRFHTYKDEYSSKRSFDAIYKLVNIR